jgi:AI-2E family transporter
MYGVGFLLIGLQHAVFLAVFTAIFSLIPCIGNLIGILLPILVALVNQGSMTIVLGVLAVFAVAQLFESYILEPLLVGSEVNLNPFFTILAVVAGGLLWGISGLILAIPITGVARIIFAHIGPLARRGDRAFVVVRSDRYRRLDRRRGQLHHRTGSGQSRGRRAGVSGTTALRAMISCNGPRRTVYCC